MKYNVAFIKDKYKDIAKVMEVADTESMSIGQAYKAVVNAIFALNEAIGISKQLSILSVKQEDIDDFFN